MSAALLAILLAIDGGAPVELAQAEPVGTSETWQTVEGGSSYKLMVPTLEYRRMYSVSFGMAGVGAAMGGYTARSRHYVYLTGATGRSAAGLSAREFSIGYQFEFYDDGYQVGGETRLTHFNLDFKHSEQPNDTGIATGIALFGSVDIFRVEDLAIYLELRAQWDAYLDRPTVGGAGLRLGMRT